MTKKDQDFLKELYQIYLIVMIGICVFLTNIFVTVGYKVIYHISLSGTLIWLVLSIALSPLAIYTRGMKQIQENFILSNWRRILFFFLPMIVAVVVGIFVAHQENRQNVAEYGIGISFISYQKTTFKPLTQKQTTLVAERLEAADHKEELMAGKEQSYYIFYKSTCPYCRVGLTSLIERLPEERKGELVFIDLNVTDADRVAGSLGVDEAGTVVSVVADKETGSYKITKDTIASDDEKGGIVANKDLIDKMVVKENV